MAFGVTGLLGSLSSLLSAQSWQECPKAISWVPGYRILDYQSDRVAGQSVAPDPDSKVHGANMGPIWGRQDPVGPMLAPWTLLTGESYYHKQTHQ